MSGPRRRALTAAPFTRRYQRFDQARLRVRNIAWITRPRRGWPKASIRTLAEHPLLAAKPKKGPVDEGCVDGHLKPQGDNKWGGAGAPGNSSQVHLGGRPSGMNIKLALLVGLGMASTAPCAAAEPAARASLADAFVLRLETLALIETLNADLLASRSATATLEKWCADHRMAPEVKIVARHALGAEKPASEETRKRLRLGEAEPVRYRHVQLVCGEHVLSEADNWYAPARLTDEMNRLLDQTETPFGRAVQALHPFRRTFEAKLLWSPLPFGWEMTGPPQADAKDDTGALVIPRDIIEHRALLYTEDQRPFSEVDETYTSGILEFEPIRPR